jgi:catechol 2,3-dioxygenase-like lactoylglutathione lyase family enzyme
MLGNQDATATVAVKDIETARRFYEDKLGLKPAGAESHGVITSAPGNPAR